ncbi:MAG: acyl-CoA dehydratase activase [Deltaproteobacteria bacterium]|jgi:predicted CoA-substrate-specific enzyme activase|nr:acyl-CoA dehydratase activase [Deltaproteobacteria bacterium]
MPLNPGFESDLFLGLDAGSISVKLALLDGSGRLLADIYARHHGRPYATALSCLEDLFKSYDPASIHAPGVTGVSAGRLAELLGGQAVGEIMALTLAARRYSPDTKNLIDIGGEDTKLLWFGQDPQLGLILSDFAMNAICAAGTGSFLDQQAHRLGYDISRFGQLALDSQVPPRVAGRCSVFAKSDMIHLQQSATPDYEIIYGLCLAMARNLKSGLAKGRPLTPPVLFVGGVAKNPGLARALKEILELDDSGLNIPPHHLVFAAAGAAEVIVSEVRDVAKDIVQDNVRDKLKNRINANQPTGIKLDKLTAFTRDAHSNPTRLPPLVRPTRSPKTAEFDWSKVSHKDPVDVYIGVDVGSVSTNVALVTPQGRLVARQYLPTAGRPLEAIAKGFAAICPEVDGKANVLGACATGSGRYLTADYLGADMTVNEITAQATAAVAIDPAVDTIFEIGGQDSKYISIQDGVIVDFMMNKACAAGTGSFLEEQADKLGLEIKGEFGELALSAKGPVALGERCTVFMESDLVHHQQNGVDLKDLTAGLCHGIVANYLGRVVETRHIGQNIFFQGGTSFNQGVAAAFASKLGRSVTVPDNADVTGAVGAAMIARDRRTWEKSSFVGFDLTRRGYQIKSFECRHCANRCEIRKVTVEGGRPFFYGSRCDRYEEDGARAAKTSRFPDLFAFRSQACFNPPELAQILSTESQESRPKIGLIRTMFFAELGPFWSVFWAALGFEPIWSSPTNKTIIHQGCERTESDFCFPIKAAHGHILDLKSKNVDHIFLPSMVNMPASANQGAPDNAACPYAQTLAFTASSALDLKEPLFLTGPVFFSEGEKSLTNSLIDIAAKASISASQVKAAIPLALKALESFQKTLQDKGREILATLGPDDLAMVVVGRPYNGFDPGLNLRLNQKIADLGILALPMDLLPLDSTHDEPMSHYWRYGQKITAAATAISADDRLEGLYISNFGCGPDSFILHFFKHLLGKKPFLEIEIDEHSSDVGAVTRLEAFLDSLKARKARIARQGREPRYPAKPLKVSRGPKRGQVIYIPPMCDHTKAIAAVFRSAGLNAISLPESDAETIELGRSQTSGKECYPLVLTVGDFVKLTKQKDFDPASSALFMPSSNGPCRFGQYSRYISLVMKRLGFEGLEVVSIDQTGGMYEALNRAGSTKSGTALSRNAWRGLVAVDLLQKALLHTRPRETRPGLADQAYQDSLTEVVAVLEQDNLRAISKALARARERFEAARLKSLNSKPKVGVVGEIYVRHNSFANEEVIRRLEALGAEILCPPFSEWIFYVGFVNAMRAKRVGKWLKTMAFNLTSLIQGLDLNRLAKAWRGFFPDGATDPPVSEVIDFGERFLNRAFQGEAILSLGKGLEFFQHGAKGLVNVMPFTCMPGMIVSGLTSDLRDQASGMPAINLAFDGQSQTNTQARLEAFMYQVHNFKSPRSH